jgi:hypothetical protein
MYISLRESCATGFRKWSASHQVTYGGGGTLPQRDSVTMPGGDAAAVTPTTSPLTPLPSRGEGTP